MVLLVADVGGTNTRLALAGESGLSHVMRFENDCFTNFSSVLAGYRARFDLPDLTGGCIAMADPVAGGRLC